MEKLITYFGQTARVRCDEKCNKAWGSDSRPRIFPEICETQIFGLDGSSTYPDNDDIDVDNYAYCTDDELGEAPIRPDTGEGGDFKPKNDSEKGNKWCIRECERCRMSEPNMWQEPLELIDFTKRFYNCHPHVR